MNKLILTIVSLAIFLNKNCVDSFKIHRKESDARAVAVLKGSLNGSEIAGTVKFSQSSQTETLTITVNMTGLPTGQGNLQHGLHVHQYGINDTSDNLTAICLSSGPHFNPENLTHGNISDTIRHVGDYGNVISDNKGVISVTFVDTVSQLYGPFGIIGRTIVLHQKVDDLGRGGNPESLINGNAGARIACGVIGISP